MDAEVGCKEDGRRGWMQIGWMHRLDAEVWMHRV